MTSLRAASATDTGRIRQTNQDQVLLGDGLFAVADGMGGHLAGEVASLTAVEALRASFRADDGQPLSSDNLRAAVEAANWAVFEQSGSKAELRGMGTTMTAVALIKADDEERLAVANVGDSRAYVFTQGELTQLTEDHSVPEELVRQGQLTPEEVVDHPQRHILTRALGISPAVEVDLWEVLPYTGDRILLCSDGLCRELSDDQIAAVLRRLADPAEAANELVSRARASGGSDNISVVIIDVVDDDDRARAASAALGSSGAAGGAASGAASAVEISTEDRSEPPASPPVATPAADEPKVPRRRRLTLRVVGFLLLLLIVLGAAAGAIGYYARDTYYVGLGSGVGNGPAQVVIYKGRPGGLLWFKPTVAERTQSTSADVLPSRLPDLRAGKIEANLDLARRYIGNLLTEAAAVHPSSTTLPPLPSGTGVTTTAP